MISDVGPSVFSCVMLFPGRASVHVVSYDKVSSIDFIFRDLFGAGLDREDFEKAVVHGPEAFEGSELEKCLSLLLFSNIHNGFHADRLSKMAGFYKTNKGLKIFTTKAPRHEKGL